MRRSLRLQRNPGVDDDRQPSTSTSSRNRDRGDMLQKGRIKRSSSSQQGPVNFLSNKGLEEDDQKKQSKKRATVDPNDPIIALNGIKQKRQRISADQRTLQDASSLLTTSLNPLYIDHVSFEKRNRHHG